MKRNPDIDDAEQARRRSMMVEEQIARRGVKDAIVLAAMNKVPRHVFVEPFLRDRAYFDYPLSIGQGQTISQPYTVAFMTEALLLDGNETVLEIGSGCGYQTAILLEIVKKVYCVERIAELADLANVYLDLLGYSGFEIVVGDGSVGLPEHAPYDAIVVAAAAPRAPESLKRQLALGGRLVIPVGDRDTQSIIRVTRRSENDFDEENLGAFRFVPLVGKEGWDS